MGLRAVGIQDYSKPCLQVLDAAGGGGGGGGGEVAILRGHMEKCWGGGGGGWNRMEKLCMGMRINGKKEL